MEEPTPRLGLTERRDLRGGRTSWRAEDIPIVQSDPLPEGRVDVAIIGAGIMGAAVAERLAFQGRRVAVLDRRPPAHGSTAASTALVMWGIDVPLSHLSLALGFDEAARRFRGKPAGELPWRTKIEQPGVMDLIGVADVIAKLEEAMRRPAGIAAPR